MTAMHETTEFLTDAPSEYDGFSTRSLAIVGVSRRRGNPVRRVLVELRDYEWQTQRYISGDHLYTTERITRETFTRCGDWILADWISDRANRDAADRRIMQLERALSAAGVPIPEEEDEDLTP